MDEFLFNRTDIEVKDEPDDCYAITARDNKKSIILEFNLIESLNPENILDSYIYAQPSFELEISKKQLPNFIKVLSGFCD